LTDARRRVLDGQAERLFDMLREYSKDVGGFSFLSFEFWD